MRFVDVLLAISAATHSADRYTVRCLLLLCLLLLSLSLGTVSHVFADIFGLGF